jgi:hypothetical protein
MGSVEKISNRIVDSGSVGMLSAPALAPER